MGCRTHTSSYTVVQARDAHGWSKDSCLQVMQMGTPWVPGVDMAGAAGLEAAGKGCWGGAEDGDAKGDMGAVCCCCGCCACSV